MKIKYFIAFISMLVCNYAFSCSCYFPDEHMDESDAKAEYVFIAKPTGKNGFLSVSNNRFKFKEITFLKGDPNEKVNVWSEKMFFGCGQYFNEKAEYVVFAYEEKGRLHTSRCSSWNASTYTKSTETVINYYKNKKNNSNKQLE